MTEQQVRDLVDQVRRRDPEARAAYLDAVCAGKPELRAAVAAWFDAEFRTHRSNQALAVNSSLTLARIGGAAADPTSVTQLTCEAVAGWTNGHGSAMDRALACAAVFALRDQHGDAARVCRDAFATDHIEPSAGWALPIEPLLAASAHREAWASTLATLEHRAS